MTAFLDRMLWTVDDDGETTHRLGAEWDGNSSPRWQWGRYTHEAELWELNVGTSWSRWGIGVEADWNRYSAWVPGVGRRLPYREQSAQLSIGPLYVSWRRVRPARVPDAASLRRERARG